MRNEYIYAQLYVPLWIKWMQNKLNWIVQFYLRTFLYIMCNKSALIIIDKIYKNAIHNLD